MALGRGISFPVNLDHKAPVNHLGHALLLADLVDEGLVDVGNDTTTRDGRLHSNRGGIAQRQ